MRNPPEEFFDHSSSIPTIYFGYKDSLEEKILIGATRGVLPPDLSYEIFQRCHVFAVSVPGEETFLLKNLVRQNPERIGERKAIMEFLLAVYRSIFFCRCGAHPAFT